MKNISCILPTPTYLRKILEFVKEDPGRRRYRRRYQAVKTSQMSACTNGRYFTGANVLKHLNSVCLRQTAVILQVQIKM